MSIKSYGYVSYAIPESGETPPPTQVTLKPPIQLSRSLMTASHLSARASFKVSMPARIWTAKSKGQGWAALFLECNFCAF